MTDSAGAFAFLDLAPGDYVIEVRYIGLLFVRDSITYAGDGLGIVVVLASPQVGLRQCARLGVMDPASASPPAPALPRAPRS